MANGRLGAFILFAFLICVPVAFSANFTYKMSMTIASPSAQSNYDVLVSVDTQTLISAGKMLSNCFDMRFYDSDDSSQLSFWLESGCNTNNTAVWVTVPVIPNGIKTIYMYYGNSTATSASQAWAGSFVIMYNESCPAGWTRFSALDGKFPMGSSTYGSAGGSTPSHSYSFSTGAANNIAPSLGSAGSVQSLNTHTHSFSGSASSSLPPYLNTVFCSNTALSIPAKTISMFSTNSLASGWNRFSTLDNRFPRGNSSYGETGGADSHFHTISGTTGGSEGVTAINNLQSGIYNMSRIAHTHPYSGTSASSSSMPSYQTLVFAQADSQTSPVSGMILITTSTPPKGWTRVSSLDSRFPEGSAVYGSTGGASTHSHSISVSTSAGNSAPITVYGGAGASPPCWSYHTHASSIGTLSEISNIPPYLSVLFFERKTPITTVASGPPKAVNFSSASGSTNFSAAPDLGNITNLTLATLKGRIKFAENHAIDATGQDYDSKVVIGNGFISVNSADLHSTFNSSATLTLNNVSCPATVYYASGFFNSSDAVLAEGDICNPTTNPSCTNITCSGGNLTFTVSHFTGFAYAATVNLTIWDETDGGMPYGNQMKYIGQNIRFFANYSNSTSEPITGATCQIWFSDSGWASMNWNSTNLYEYTRSFSSGGAVNWNVSCNKSGQATLDANDTVLVNSTIAVILGAPADNAIVKSSVILYNWTPYGFPGDPTCNLTRNGSVAYSATCTNNALCGYTNTTANGNYLWNVTCYSGATTRTSSTRNLTVNTLYRSPIAEGMLNMNITQITSISLPQNSISFGTVEITKTYDSYPDQFFVIKNDGNVLVDVEVNATNPFLGSNCTALPCAAYQVKAGANETAPYPTCSGSPTKESYTNMYGSSSGLLINDLNFADNNDSANIYIRFILPGDEPPGSKSSTVTFWAKSAGSYSCN